MKIFVVWIKCILLLTITAQANTYYLDANGGNDAFPGTVAQPWKTLSKSLSVVKSGDTVILNNGNYGPFTKNIGNVGNTTWISFIAAQGQTQVKFDKIYVYGNEVEAYFNFVGIDVEFPELPSCVLTSIPIAYFKGVNFIKLSKCKIHSVNTYDSDGGVNFFANTGNTNAIHDLEVDSCEIYNTQTGIRFAGMNTIITNNHIHHIHGTFIGNPCGKMSVTNLNSSQNVLIENNHMHDMHFYTTEPCYDNTFSSAHASIIGIRGRDWIVRNNHIHDAWSPGIQLYSNDCGGEYDRANLLFENNIIYDNQGYQSFYNPGTGSGNYIGGKIVFRHNTIISGRQDSSWTFSNNPVNRFKASGHVQSISLILSLPSENPYDGDGTVFEDNIFITETGIGNFNYQAYNDPVAKWIASNNLIYTRLWNCGTLDPTNIIITNEINNKTISADYIDNQLFVAPNFTKQHELTHSPQSNFDLTPLNGSVICTMSSTGGYVGAIPCSSSTKISDENGSNSIFVYPNPAKEYLTISFGDETIRNEPIQIINSLGILMKTVETDQFSQISIADLPKGLYFIHFSNPSFQPGKFLKF